MKTGDVISKNKYKSFLILGAFLSTVTFANEIDYFELSIEDLLNTQITVATAVPVNVVNAPSSVSLFTKNDIERLGITKLSELYNFIPGFLSQYNSAEGNQSYLITRGHAQKYSNTVLFLLNGQRINDDYTGGINYFIRYFDLTNVERIEIIRGPGSALYGSNAFNGVINIITKIENHFSLSSGDKLNYSTSFGTRLKKGEFSAAIALQTLSDGGDNFDNLFDRFEIEQNTQDPYTSSQLNLSLDYKNISYQSFYTKSDREQFYLFRRLANNINSLNLASENHQLRFKQTFTNELNLDVSAHVFNARRKSQGQLTPQGIGGFSQSPFLFGVDVKYRSYSTSVNLDIPILINHHLFVGASYTSSELPKAALASNYNLFGDFENLDAFTIFDDAAQRTVLDVTRETSSVYFQLQSQLTQNLNSTLGLRYDEYNDVKGKLNPRVAINYSASKKHSYKFIYSEAYRVPSIGDLYDEESGLTLGNQSLEPTTLQSTELVYSYLDDNSYFSAIYFDNKIKNLIGFASGEISRLNNIASNHASGVELEWKQILSEKITTNFALTNLFSNKSTLTEESSLTPSELLVPDLYLSVLLDYKLLDNMSANIQFFWNNPIEVVDNSENNKVNITATYKMTNKSSVQLKISNLFDSALSSGSYISLGYDDNTNTEIQSYPLRGRQLTLKYKLKF